MKDFILKLFGYSEEYIKYLKSDNDKLINLVVELQGSNSKLRDDLENRYKTLNELLETKTILTAEVLKLQEENNKLKQYITNLKTKLKNTSFEIDELNSNLQAINIDLDELVTSELDTED